MITTCRERFRHLLISHGVRTARAMGWAEFENGRLLSIAESAGFEVMVTADKNLRYQQNLAGRTLALVVLGTNDWNRLRQSAHLAVQAVDAATPGSFRFVSFEPRP